MTHSVWASAWSTVPNFICKKFKKHEELTNQSYLTVRVLVQGTGLVSNDKQLRNKIGVQGKPVNATVINTRKKKDIKQ